MLNIPKLLVESKKHRFDNRDAVIAILTELKNKETLLTKDKTVKRSAEQQYIWLREMQKQKEDNIAIYQAERKTDLLIKEKNELKAINQFIPLVLNFLSPVKVEDEITVEILSIMSKNYGLRDIMEYFKSKYPTIDKNLVSKLTKKVLQK